MSECVKLKYICESYNGNLVASSLKEEGKTPVYGAGGLSGYTDKDGMPYEYLGIVKDGAGVGRICKYPKGSLLVGTLAYIIPKQGFNIDWIKYCITNLNLADSIDKTTIPHVYFSQYGNEMVPVLEIANQEKIADFLDKKINQIDELISNQEKQIEKLEELKKRKIVQIVNQGLGNNKLVDSQVDYILSYKEGWKLLRGKTVLKLLDRQVLPNDQVITCFRDGEVTLRNKRREEGFTFSEKEIGYQGIEEGDLVIHGMDGFAGAIGISTDRGKGSPILNVCDSSENKKYIMYYLRSLAYRNVILALSTGIRVRSCDLRWNKLSNLLYPIPPKKEQNEIVIHLDKLCDDANKLIYAKQEKIKKIQAYKTSLIYEYVTGKRRIK